MNGRVDTAALTVEGAVDMSCTGAVVAALVYSRMPLLAAEMRCYRDCDDLSIPNGRQQGYS